MLLPAAGDLISSTFHPGSAPTRTVTALSSEVSEVFDTVCSVAQPMAAVSKIAVNVIIRIRSP
jgi:hypothetical protein